MKNLVTIVIMLLTIVVKGTCLYFLWNIIAPLINVGVITYWNSLLVMLFITIILFKVNVKWRTE